MKNNFKDLSPIHSYDIFTFLLSVYFKVVKTLLESGKCKLDIKNKLGHTPLHEAAKQVKTLHIWPLLVCTINGTFYPEEGPISRHQKNDTLLHVLDVQNGSSKV